jgi:hypothetical protein
MSRLEEHSMVPLAELDRFHNDRHFIDRKVTELGKHGQYYDTAKLFCRNSQVLGSAGRSSSPEFHWKPWERRPLVVAPLSAGQSSHSGSQSPKPLTHRLYFASASRGVVINNLEMKHASISS